MSHEHAAFALCVDPLLRILDQKLPGFRIGKRARKTVVVACTDDITVFATIPTELRVIRDAITSYEKATGARLSTRKSKELAVGGWNTSTDTLIIPWPAEIKIPGFTFASTIEHSMKKSWANVTGKVIAQARDTYERKIPVGTRISARSDRPWGPLSLLLKEYWVFLGGKKRSGYAADHS